MKINREKSGDRQTNRERRGKHGKRERHTHHRDRQADAMKKKM